MYCPSSGLWLSQTFLESSSLLRRHRWDATMVAQTVVRVHVATFVLEVAKEDVRTLVIPDVSKVAQALATTHVFMVVPVGTSINRMFELV